MLSNGGSNVTATSAPIVDSRGTTLALSDSRTLSNWSGVNPSA